MRPSLTGDGVAHAAAFAVDGFELSMAGMAEQRRAWASLTRDGMDCGIAGIDIYVISIALARAEERRTGTDLTRNGLFGRGTMLAAMVTHTYSLCGVDCVALLLTTRYNI